MSLYSVQKAMYLLKKDPSFGQALKNDPEAALQPFEVTPQERAALATGDLPQLYRMGVHPLLLAPYSRAMGIPRPRYQELLAPLKGSRRLSSELDLGAADSTNAQNGTQA